MYVSTIGGGVTRAAAVERWAMGKSKRTSNYRKKKKRAGCKERLYVKLKGLDSDLARVKAQLEKTEKDNKRLLIKLNASSRLVQG